MAEETKGEKRRRASTDGADFTDSQHKATKEEMSSGTGAATGSVISTATIGVSSFTGGFT